MGRGVSSVADEIRVRVSVEGGVIELGAAEEAEFEVDLAVRAAEGRERGNLRRRVESWRSLRGRRRVATRGLGVSEGLE